MPGKIAKFIVKFLVYSFMLILIVSAMCSISSLIAFLFGLINLSWGNPFITHALRVFGNSILVFLICVIIHEAIGGEVFRCLIENKMEEMKKEKEWEA
jgi:uncharacterized protein YacL